MKNNIHNLLVNFISLILIIVAAATPLLFTNLTTNFYDIPKLILLVVTTVSLLGLWILSWILRGKVVITRTPLDVPLFLLLLTILASMYFSTSRYTSIFGAFPEVYDSAIAWTSYILLYFIAASNLIRVGQIKLLTYAFYISAGLVSLISILSFFGVFLPFEMAQGVNFTPTGSTFSTVAFLLLLLPITLFSILHQKNYIHQIVVTVLSILFSTTIVLIGSVAASVLLVVIYAAVLTLSRDKLSSLSLPLYLIPIAFSALFLLLVNIPFDGNLFQEARASFPVEIQLPIDTSWKISISAFRDAPFVGTGPATFLFNFTNYKPAEFNQLDFWNLSFGSGYNQYLQVLGTWGLFGILSLVVFSILVVNNSRKVLLSHDTDNHYLIKALAVSGVLSIVLLFIHASTLTSIFTSFMFLAAFMASQKNIRERVSEFAIGVKVATSNNKQIDLLPIMLFVIYLIAAVPISGRLYNTVVADYYHRKALSQANINGTKTYEYLQKAENLNPYIDLYRVDLAQTNFALANALAQQKGPTQENPEGALTDEDKKTIQTLVTQSINEGRASIVLSPRSARNWEVLALLYKNITGVANNSLTFALDAYGRAIQLDPMNPALRVEVGSLYYATENYDMSVRFFTDAVNLKPDYVNGYYNLAIALRKKGDLENAQLIAEQAVSLLQQDFSSQGNLTAPDLVKETKRRDLNTANELLNQIRNEIATGQTTDVAGLQNPELPDIDVPSLDQPPETDTVPPVVEDNPDAVLPEITP